MTIVEKDPRTAAFVKEIILLDSLDDTLHKLPFYADGYPGILFSETEEPILLQPFNKLLPDFFLYGQTIEPITLEIQGPYKMVVFQLYPFATRLLLGINPKEINDACYDLNQVENIDTAKTTASLRSAKTKKQVNIISEYVLNLVRNAINHTDNSVKLAVSTIINAKGVIAIKQLREQLFISERTFERKFLKEVGVTAKQFARIIQFSFSLNQIQESDYTKLTNIAYDNGFTDQSHFIKTFKQFAGGTPKEILATLG